MKKPSLKEKVQVYEDFLHRLNFHRSITMNEQAVKTMLELVDAWSAAHRADVPAVMEARISQAFDKLKALP